MIYSFCENCVPALLPMRSGVRRIMPPPFMVVLGGIDNDGSKKASLSSRKYFFILKM